MGLYVYDKKSSGTDHYNAVDFTVKMTLSCYNSRGNGTYDTIFNWAPYRKQWWITGFSGYNEKFLNPDCNKMMVIGTVDLSDHQEMYQEFKKMWNKNKNSQEKYKYILFDDTTYKVWICWYEGV